MDKKELRCICQGRLDAWLNHLVQEHSTPAILIGVGHDQKSGQLVLISLEDLKNDEVIRLLENILDLIVK
jgi:hypothetical protein